MILKKTLDVKGLLGLSCTPLALCPEARNRAGVKPHPHHLLLGKARNLRGRF
jgi:hypothetical protein